MSLTDQQIADKFGLTKQDVIDIRAALAPPAATAAPGQEAHRASAPPPADAGAPSDETAWLIEHRPSPGIVLWWSGRFSRHPADSWGNASLTAELTNDAGEAARFATRESAQKVLDGFLAMRPFCVFANAPSTYLVTQHMWCAPPAPTAAARDGDSNA